MNEHVAPPRTKYWTSDDVTIAANIWQFEIGDRFGTSVPLSARQRAYHKIAAAVGRTFTAIEVRFSLYGPSFNSNTRATSSGNYVNASARAIADRDERAAARMRQDVTASTFGDPPPGYSALDRRR